MRNIRLEKLSIGDIFKVSGIEWMIVAKNHEGYPDNSVTIMSKDVLEKRVFDTHGGEHGSNHWGNSDLRKYLNGEFYNKLDPSFKAAILETNLINVENNANYNGNTYYTKDKIFIPSFEELGFKDIDCAKPIGTDYGAFKTNESKITKLSGNSPYYWTRAPYYYYSDFVCIVYSDGSDYCDDSAKFDWGIRPTLNLKANIII
ncbi:MULTISPECIES: DUF6273 domain-containing protein [Clostridium]|jgi:hypothetical protein|uniref:DUF6273 domain-containing protein n=1 Tax=Clostridium TaxID=1485 RepID=UPI0024305A45|nr:DUF6273 domain-containing protein [Clostridium tyrobutyricum]